MIALVENLVWSLHSYTSMGLFWEWILASSARWDLNVAPEFFSQLGPLQGPYQARVKIWYNFQGCNSVWRQEAPYEVIRKVTLSFTPYPLLQWYLIVWKSLLNLSMKCCWNLAFNAQRSRVIIVVVQVGAVKIYVAAVERLEKKGRQDETHSTTKISWKN